MKYVLILLVLSGTRVGWGVDVTTQEFQTQTACEVAVLRVEQMRDSFSYGRGVQVRAKCVPAGDQQ